MSVVAATKTPVQKLKKASLVLLLSGVTAFAIGFIALMIYSQMPVTFTATPGVATISSIGLLGVFGGVLTLFASLIVRLVAAIKS